MVELLTSTTNKPSWDVKDDVCNVGIQLLHECCMELLFSPSYYPVE